MSILAPQFLVKYIPEISLLLAVVALIFFSDVLFRVIVFPVSGLIKTKTSQEIKSIIKNGYGKILAKYGSESLATVVFLAYCFFGTYLLKEYLFIPILSRMRSFILVVIIVFFLIISYIVNNEKIRKKFIRF